MLRLLSFFGVPFRAPPARCSFFAAKSLLLSCASLATFFWLNMHFQPFFRAGDLQFCESRRLGLVRPQDPSWCPAESQETTDNTTDRQQTLKERQRLTHETTQQRNTKHATRVTQDKRRRDNTRDETRQDETRRDKTSTHLSIYICTHTHIQIREHVQRHQARPPDNCGTPPVSGSSNLRVHCLLDGSHTAGKL